MKRFAKASFHLQGDLQQESLHGALDDLLLQHATPTVQDWQLSYRFETHFHPYVSELLERLVEGSVAHLQEADTEERELPGGARRSIFHEALFTDREYDPGPLVESPYPVADLALGHGDAYGVYNWELFFHVPLLIAIHLSRNGRFAEAQRWFHYVFDPTDDSDGPTPQRFWKFRRFRTTDVELVESILLNLSTGEDEALLQETLDSIAAWRESPFTPHAVARYRPSAFMMKTVMAYLDNLIAWGDSLFRQDTRETINEATQLYVLAANILGPEPQVVPGARKPRSRTYADFRGRLDALSNALTSLETEVPHDGLGDPGEAAGDGRASLVLDSGASLYFCVPRNEKLLGYWKTVADRLFKIRNSLNIRGVFRQLALFDPPIDPALLARGAAAGLDIGAVVSGLQQPLALVRYRTLLAKALELAGEVRSLGGNLLSALQQEDAAALAALRQQHEEVVLQMGERVRYAQVQEGAKNRQGIESSIDTAFQRYRYYERLLGRDDNDLELPEWVGLDAAELAALRLRAREPELPFRDIDISVAEDATGPTGGRLLSHNEAEELEGQRSSVGLRTSASAMDAIAQVMGMIPEMGGKIQPMGAGADFQFGGRELSKMFSMMASGLRTGADVAAARAARMGRIAGYERREQDWALQSNLAAGELNLLFRQLRAAEIREAVAEYELETHRQRMEQAAEMRTFLEEQTTHREFYAWMKRELQGLHQQTYELAFDVAKKAERALQHELGDPGLSFVGYGHRAGREGLLAGEKLTLDLRRMDLAHQDQNRRDYELTTHISLRQVAPLALLQLRSTGSCRWVLPEEVFDRNCPGHFFRRIRSVALTIPSVVGPYTGVHARLTLTKSRVRVAADGATPEGYPWTGPEDPRFSDHYGRVESIVTSTARDDGGYFEPAPGDDRYLPFEGAGAISDWSLELPSEYRAFDYGTISDVVLTVRYTAREGGQPLADAATGALRDSLALAGAAGQTRLFSVRHDFPSEWARFRAAEGDGPFTLDLTLGEEHYPFWARNHLGAVHQVALLADTDQPAVDLTENADGSGASDTLELDPSQGDLRVGLLDAVPLPDTTGDLALHLSDNDLRDLWIAVTWEAD